MKTKGSFALDPIKKIGYMILVAIILIIVSFIALQSRLAKQQYEDKMIINIFGKQRMYSQMISKDASHLYLLMQALVFDEYFPGKEEVEKRVLDVKNSLSLAEEEFTNTLSSMVKGIIHKHNISINISKSLNDTTVYIKDIQSVWYKYQNAITILLDSSELNQEMAEAVIYINEHNLELLQLCDQIQETLLQSSIESARVMNYLFYGLIAALCLITLISMLHLLKFIILPFHQLYKGISEIGLEQTPEQPHLPTKKKMKPLINEINDMFTKINNLISLIENMNNNASFTESLDFINQTFSQFIPYNYIGIALIDEEKGVIRASYGVSDGSVNGITEKIMGTAWPIDSTSLGNLIHTGEARIINDLELYTKDKPMSMYNKVILEAGIRSSITLPLKVSGVPVGVIFFSSRQKYVYTNEHLKFLKTLANSIAISLNQNIFINDLLFGSILALAKLAEARDVDTGDHLERMQRYTRVIAELLYENNNFSDEITLEYIDNIEKFSPLHDIGKVGIRDGILLKPGKLTMEEFNEMKKHAVYGAEVIRAAESSIIKRRKGLFTLGIEIVEGHHEKWDGSGYPFGKAGLDIPLSARIVAVADVFDALTSRRPYKDPFSFGHSMEIISEGRGKHFDPKIVDVVLANQHRLEKIYHQFHNNV